MAPPQLTSLENYSDVQFRDVVHRRSMLVAPTANVLQKLYHHVAGDGSVRLSSAELLTTDAGGNVQYALMLGSNVQFLEGNTLTSANASSWTANSVFSANASHMNVRVPTLTASTIACQSLNLSNDVSFANVTAANMMVTGNINVDTSTLTVNPALNRVGIVQSSPQYPLDVTGDTNISSGSVLRIGGTQVLSSTTLGSGVTTSSLTSVGTLGSLSVTGNVAAGNLRTNVISATAISASSLAATGAVAANHLDAVTVAGQLQTASQPLITSVGALSSLQVTGNASVGNVSANAITGTRASLSQLSVAGAASVTGAGTLGSLTVNGASLFNGQIVQTTGVASFGETEVVGDLLVTDLTTLNTFTANACTGDLTLTSGRLTAYGTNHVLDSTASISLRRTITGLAQVNTGIFVGNITHLAACSKLEVTLTMRVDANNSVSKAYVIPIRPDWYWEGWKRALPISSSHASTQQYSNDISLDLLWDTTKISLAIARSKSDLTAENAVVDIGLRFTFQKLSGWNPAIDFEPSTAAYTAPMGSATGIGVSPAADKLLPTTPLTQTGTLTVGIGKYRPDANLRLDVGGASSFDGVVTCKGGLVIESGGFGYSGNMILEGCQVGNTGLMFSSFWRLWLNPTTQNLEIHQNNNTNDVSWTSGYTVTGILAAK